MSFLYFLLLIFIYVFSKVESHFHRALEIPSAFPLIAHLYGCFLAQGQQHQRALHILLTIIEKYPDCVESLACIGLLLSHHGHYIGIKILAKLRFMFELKTLLETASLSK
jgi:hypothetical protein